MTLVVDFNDQGPEHWLKALRDSKEASRLEQVMRDRLRKRRLTNRSDDQPQPDQTSDTNHDEADA